ncbi:MAG: ABC transporter permease [Anaerolineaceae bacterium]|jgi:simple sugar transport system permease protein|nr:ABC transporter permease [Anaerolineaceae bacterium]
MILNEILSVFTSEYFFVVIRMATPIILAAIAETFLERSGIINLGCEGMMMFGAFFGALGSWLTGNPYLGLLLAIISGLVAGGFFGFMTISLKGNQIVVGMAFIVLGYSLTSFLYRMILGIQLHPVKVAGIQAFDIPLLSQIPIIGRVFFQQNPLVYFTYFVIIAAWVIMYRTSIGLKISAIGENPKAADSMGINVIRWRYICTIATGALFAIAGACLSLTQLSLFADNMTGGRGFFALAAVILGRWNPIGATAGALLFGAGDAFQMRLQAYGIPIPSDVLLAMPYVLTLLAVIFFRNRSSYPPSALTQPFEREVNKSHGK